MSEDNKYSLGGLPLYEFSLNLIFLTPLNLFYCCLQVSELSQQLELESKKCMQLEAQNQDLQKELSALHANREILEKSKCQLKEEVAYLRHCLETNMVDHSQLSVIKERWKNKLDKKSDKSYKKSICFCRYIN